MKISFTLRDSIVFAALSRTRSDEKVSLVRATPFTFACVWWISSEMVCA